MTAAFQYNLKRSPFLRFYSLLLTESEPKTQLHQLAAVKPTVCRKIDGTQNKEDQKMTTLKKGDSAPDFNLTDQAGKQVKLADFKGKKVLLYFYPKANTSG